MANVSIAIGLVLIILGVAGYLGTGQESITALIPAAFGLPLLILGFVGREESRLKLTMHISLVVAMVGMLGSARGIPGALAVLRGDEIERPAAALVQAAMMLLCLLFVALGIRSFVEARRSR